MPGHGQQLVSAPDLGSNWLVRLDMGNNWLERKDMGSCWQHNGLTNVSMGLARPPSIVLRVLACTHMGNLTKGVLASEQTWAWALPGR